MPYITPWLCGWEVFWIILLSHFSRVRLCVTPWTAAHQAPPSLGFSRQEHGVGCHFLLQCMKVKSESELTQSCPTLCDPIDSSPPDSAVPGILQARTLEWVSISFSIAWKWKVKVKSLSHVWFLATPRTAAHQAPPSMGFSRQEYWSRLPLSSPNDGIEHPKSGERHGYPILKLTIVVQWWCW